MRFILELNYWWYVILQLYILIQQLLFGIADTIKLLCTPLKIFNINTDEIKLLTCISLSMIPVLRKELYEIKDSCKAKNISFNIRNIKYILLKFCICVIRRVNELEEALIAKGYN